MRTMALLILITLVSCNRNPSYHASHFFEERRKPLIQLLPMEDHTNAPLSEETAIAFSQAISQRLSQNKHLQLNTSKRVKEQFRISMQLVKFIPCEQNPSELITSIHLKILDVRSETPRIILQEVISRNTFLNQPLTGKETLSWEEPHFRISPLGLTYAKISREIAAHIEDYILLATKG